MMTDRGANECGACSTISSPVGRGRRRNPFSNRGRLQLTSRNHANTHTDTNADASGNARSAERHLPTIDVRDVHLARGHAGQLC
jgi:hypothetical protein